MDPATRLSLAEAHAAKARRRLSDTATELRARLDPKELVQVARREASERANAAARLGSDTARRNPGVTAGALGVVTLFLARRRIARLFHRGPVAQRAAKSAGLPPPPATYSSRTD